MPPPLSCFVPFPSASPHPSTHTVARMLLRKAAHHTPVPPSPLSCFIPLPTDAPHPAPHTVAWGLLYKAKVLTPALLRMVKSLTLFLRPSWPASFPRPQVPRAPPHTLFCLGGGLLRKVKNLTLFLRSSWPASCPCPQVPRAPPHTLLLGGCSFMPFRQHEQGNVTKLSGYVLRLREQGRGQGSRRR